MPAVQELLVDVLVAAAAIAGGELGGNDEAVMVFLLLSGGGLMAVEAVDALSACSAHFVLVDDGVLGARVAFGALAGGADEFRAGLVGFDFGAGAIE